MCRKRTLLGLLLTAVCIVAGCDEGLQNCHEVTGIYHPEFEFVTALENYGEPGWCNTVTLTQLDLTEDDRTVNTGTSALHTVVNRFGCEVKITYTVTVSNPGSPQDGAQDMLFNNTRARYTVGERGVLTGETIHARAELMDINGTPTLVERCRALFNTTWLPDDVYREMHPDAGIAP